ncbi:MAG: hypothetical protein KIT33_05620 [Candidatus Kapabacteria bacterium]|nr:hypothetical protein [Ignavibacteriota bacterium]MCW5884435.1 hypothetical protein [Candidatus Kapabacteria bacterium]
MKIKLFIFNLIFLASISFLVSAPDDDFKKANDFFNQGSFLEAAELYNQLIEEGYRESEVYYNLANTYFRLEKIPLSILNYERARKLNPGDEDINFNLKLANLRIVDKFEPVPKLFLIEWYEVIVRFFYSGVWGTISVISSWVFFTSLLILFFSNLPSFRKYLSLITIISFFSIFISVYFGYEAYHFENSKVEAIIFNPSVYVKSAPDPSSTDLFILHEGTKVYIRESIDSWLQIRVENGDIGWIQKNEIEVI